MNTKAAPSVALLYPGDRAMRERADPAESRFAALFDTFAAAGVAAQPAVYHDDFAEDVRAQLVRVDAVLVWCNPLEGGRRRDRLDDLLRGVANSGVFVSAHPDAIARLGTKDVLFETRALPFGSDVYRIDSLDQLDAELPDRLRAGPRVVKQHRGHSGIGVWRVEAVGRGDDRSRVRIRHAQRGSEEHEVEWGVLRQTLAAYFEPSAGGHMIDQAWQPGLANGMVRAYIVRDRVAGFGHQAVNALFPSLIDGPLVQPGPRLYFGPSEPRFQNLKQRLESDWIDQLRDAVGLPEEQLPMLWDCDFILGDSMPDDRERFVLCEVNVSSVSPFPPSCVAPLVEAVAARVSRRQ